MVERVRPEVWDVLDEVIKDHPVLLNRAPTLHRLGIQAFEPVLVEGKAIQIHPLVCTPYNADFDGDQMAVHLPLSAGAQAEARILMLSSNNILQPSYGNPVSIPTQDMVLGLYYLTIDPNVAGAQAAKERRDDSTNARAFFSAKEAQVAYDLHAISLHESIKVRWKGQLIETTMGRVIFNQAFPENWNHPFVNKTIDKKGLTALIADCYRHYGNAETAGFLDQIKTLGFRFATISGTTVSTMDIVIPKKKGELIANADAQVASINELYRSGLFSDDEQYNKTIDVWTKTGEEVTQAMLQEQDQLNPIFMMATSGARGSIAQVKQIAGMRGLMADPSGRILSIPIKANLKEGLTVLEYFISTHGARKGLADTALRTADSGYLTRRLVDVAQDVIVREEDCDTDEGITVSDISVGREIIEPLVNRIVGRHAFADIVNPENKRDVIVKRGEEIKEDAAARIIAAGITTVGIRSVLTCEANVGVCAVCYGRNLATGGKVDIGEAVGIIAAQSIGEPGTQLTLRTFHTGGVASEDIITGLPRVEELFEARKPKGQAIITEESGSVHIQEDKGIREVVVTDAEGEEHIYEIPFNVHLTVHDADRVEAGDQLIEGSRQPARHPAHQRRDGAAELPGARSAKGLPQPGRGHQRQAHRSDRAQHAAQEEGHGSGRHVVAARPDARQREVRRRQRQGRGRWPQAGRGGHGAARRDQGVVGDRVVLVGGVVPRDDARPDPSRDRRQVRSAARAQGERDHRQADPGRDGHAEVSRSRGLGQGSTALSRGRHLRRAGTAGASRRAAAIRERVRADGGACIDRSPCPRPVRWMSRRSTARHPMARRSSVRSPKAFRTKAFRARASRHRARPWRWKRRRNRRRSASWTCSGRIHSTDLPTTRRSPVLSMGFLRIDAPHSGGHAERQGVCP